MNEELSALQESNRAGKADLEDLSISLGRNETISIKVSSALRSMIWSGRLRPGNRLVESRIARQLGVGQPTVREALIILEHEGLVVRRANKGCSVTELSVNEIDQIYRLRIDMEVLAARWAMDNARNWRPADLFAIVEQMFRAAEHGDIDKWHQCDLRFHETFWGFTGNPFLVKALLHVTLPFFAFAKLDFIREKPYDLFEQAREHEKIAQALAGGDAETAIRTVGQVLEGFWQLWSRRTHSLSGS